MNAKFRLFQHFQYYHQRYISSKSCIVYLTKTTNPYKTLAFEQWMYEKVDFSKHNCLLVWRNQPSVIIGRHQNPWKECNVSTAFTKGVNICRRNSGGGAVYHDLGNVNFTFFTERKDYNRKFNLNVIVSGLKQNWPFLDVEINCRDDVILNKQYKISGSSAKLGRNSCYHHCTLLVNSDKTNLVNYLANNNVSISCTATSSVRSKVMNLAEVNESINVDHVCDSVVTSYVQNHSFSQVFHVDTGDETLVPRVNALSKSLQSWQWIFGKTPDFTVKDDCIENSPLVTKIKLQIKKGLIVKVVVELKLFSDDNVLNRINDCLDHVQFSYKSVNHQLKKGKFNICGESLVLYNLLSQKILKLCEAS